MGTFAVGLGGLVTTTLWPSPALDLGTDKDKVVYFSAVYDEEAGTITAQAKPVRGPVLGAHVAEKMRDLALVDVTTGQPLRAQVSIENAPAAIAVQVTVDGIQVRSHGELRVERRDGAAARVAVTAANDTTLSAAARDVVVGGATYSATPAPRPPGVPGPQARSSRGVER